MQTIYEKKKDLKMKKADDMKILIVCLCRKKRFEHEESKSILMKSRWHFKYINYISMKKEKKDLKIKKADDF